MIELTVNYKIVKFNCSEKDEYKIIKDCLTYLSPDRFYSKKYHERKFDGTRVWNGKYKYYLNDSFGIGFLKLVSDELDSKGVDYRIIDKRGDISFEINFSSNFLDNNRDYQRNSVLSFLKNKKGIIRVPTRGGKTFIAAEIIRLLRDNYKSDIRIMIITDLVDLIDQNIADIREVNQDLDRDYFGVIQEDNFDVDKNIVVSMIQTIGSIIRSRNDKKSIEKRRKYRDFYKYLNKVDFLIVDEIHEYKTRKRRDFLKNLSKKVDYMLGISATPWEKGDLLDELQTKDVFGDILYDISEKDLKERNVLSDSLTIMYYNKDYEILDHGMEIKMPLKREMCDFMIYNPYRNKILVELLCILDELSLKTLVIFESVTHGSEISFQTGYKFIHGDTSKEDRSVVKDEFLEGKGKVLLVSNIYKKGITLPEVQVTILANGGAASSPVIQKRGRALGIKGDKIKSAHIDFIDDYDESKYLLGHSIERLETYQGQHENDKEIKIVKDIDKTVKILKNWFGLS